MTSSQNEVTFMANYALTTLLSLYRRLKLTQPLRLRVYEKDLVITGDAAEILRVWGVIRELALAVKSALRRLQASIAEELVVVGDGPIPGKPHTSLSAKCLPLAFPSKVLLLSFETPANILLAATILEIEARLRRVKLGLLKSWHESGNPLAETIAREVDEMIQFCEYLLAEPMLQRLAMKAGLIASNERLLSELEAKVRLDAVRRPRDYRAYGHLLRLRKELRASVHVIEEYLKEHGDALALKIPASKLYELYGFTLFLEALLEVLSEEQGAEPWRAKVIDELRILILERGSDKISVSYNALPRYVRSRLSGAKAYGLLSNGIDQTLIEKLGGLPDTIVLISIGGRRRLLVIDYKYAKTLSYLVASRFKALSYLYEFDADCAMIMIPTLGSSQSGKGSLIPESEELDEEAKEHSSFYRSIGERGGAVIEIDSNEKMLVIVHADPNDEGAGKAKRALKRVIKLLLIK